MVGAVFIDANIFLEVLLKDAKSEACKDFLVSLQRQKRSAFTTDFILYSCFLVVQKNVKGAKKTGFMKDLAVFFSSFQNLTVLRPSFQDLYDAAEIMGRTGLDFDDSLVVACMKNYEVTELASFDRHFDRLREIKRVAL